MSALPVHCHDEATTSSARVSRHPDHRTEARCQRRMRPAGAATTRWRYEQRDARLAMTQPQIPRRPDAPICQSCGMPLASAEDLGTEASGSSSRKYCGTAIRKARSPQPSPRLKRWPTSSLAARGQVLPKGRRASSLSACSRTSNAGAAAEPTVDDPAGPPRWSSGVAWRVRQDGLSAPSIHIQEIAILPGGRDLPPRVGRTARVRQNPCEWRATVRESRERGGAHAENLQKDRPDGG